MKPWQLAVLGLALLTIAGCRVDPAIPLLERELRRKDQEINRLRWQVEDLQDTASCREEREPEAEPRHNHRGSNGVKPPVTEPGIPTNKVPDTLKNPSGTLPSGIPEVPEGLGDPTPTGSSDDGPALEGMSGRFSSRPRNVSTAASSAASAIPFRPSGDSRRVASIALDRTLTGGIGSGDRSGDQGLLVVLEPSDGAGRIVDAPAEVNVAVLDPALQGEAARVARWDFTPAETAALFRRTNSAAAIHLAMGWPKNPPKHNQLRLFVRYITADGRKLEANQPIEVALPGEKTARWTPVEAPARAERSVERDPASASWRSNEMPDSRAAGPTPYIASRTSEPNSERPVWSPDRR